MIRDMLKNIFIAFFLLLLSCSSPSNKIVATTEIHDYKYNDDEIALMNMINEYRESIGLHSLDTINHMSFLSLQHNIYMIEKHVPSHDGFVQRSNELIQLFHASMVGENVAYNFKLNNDVLRAWLASSGHKENIEGGFTHFGLSIRIDSTNNRKYYTNVFMKVSK
ncbi:MAG: CAP domain-containing protein [bacterium]|nr:CAP domain-containing protein [bacterium]